MAALFLHIALLKYNINCFSPYRFLVNGFTKIEKSQLSKSGSLYPFPSLKLISALLYGWEMGNIAVE